MGFRLKPPTLIHGQAPSSGECLISTNTFSYTALTEEGEKPSLYSFVTLVSEIEMIHVDISEKSNQYLDSVAGVPSQKPKEQQRSVLRPAVLQAPPSKSHIESSEKNLLIFIYFLIL